MIQAVVCSDNEIKTEVKELQDDEDQMSPLTVKELKNLYLLDLLKDLIDVSLRVLSNNQ